MPWKYDVCVCVLELRPLNNPSTQMVAPHEYTLEGEEKKVWKRTQSPNLTMSEKSKERTWVNVSPCQRRSFRESMVRCSFVLAKLLYFAGAWPRREDTLLDDAWIAHLLGNLYEHHCIDCVRIDCRKQSSIICTSLDAHRHVRISRNSLTVVALPSLCVALYLGKSGNSEQGKSTERTKISLSPLPSTEKGNLLLYGCASVRYRAALLSAISTQESAPNSCIKCKSGAQALHVRRVHFKS